MTFVLFFFLFFSLVKGQPPHLKCANMHVVDCGPSKNFQCYSGEIKVPYDNRLCLKEPDIYVLRVSWHER